MRTKNILLITLIVLLAAIAFSPSLKNGFTNWDDDFYVSNNALIRDLSFNGIKNIFTSIHQELYKPLVLLSYALEYRFFGLNPFIYHLDNLILHLANCILVFWLLFLITKSPLAAFVSALLFAIHPLHVESVAWIAQRKDVLYSGLFLAALISYIYYLERQSRPRYYLSLVLFLLSLLAKPMAVTFTLLLFLFDFLKKRKFDAPVLIEKLPFFCLSFIGWYITIGIRHLPFSSRPLSIGSLLITGNEIVFYLKKMLLPVKLSCLYPVPSGIDQFMLPAFIISIAIVIFLAAGVVFSFRYTRKISFGAMFFLITLLPVLRIVAPEAMVGVADRYFYLPSIGLFYLVGEGFAWWYQNRLQSKFFLRAVGVCVLGLAIGLMSFLTWQRTKVWKDGVVLWRDVLTQYPHSEIAINNRGNAYYESGELGNALYYFNLAVSINPGLAKPYHNRANLFRDRKKYELAMADYARAISIEPGNTDLYNDRGIAYSLKGDSKNALGDFNQAIRLNPSDALAFNNRGILYRNRQEYDLALVDYDMAVKLKPDFAQAYYNRAITYGYKKELKKARQDLQKAASLGMPVRPELVEKIGIRS